MEIAPEKDGDGDEHINGEASVANMAFVEENVETQASRSLHLMESGEYSDVTLIVGKGKVPIRAHKFALIITSSYFENQLIVNNVKNVAEVLKSLNGETETTTCGITGQAEPEHNQNGTGSSIPNTVLSTLCITIEDVEPDDFRLFLRFVYGGILLDSIKVDEALPLMVCGTKFKVPSLVSACEKVLKRTITLDSALTLFEQAVHYNSTDLLESSLKFICMNAYKIVHREDFAQLPAKALRLIVERDNLQVYDEMQLLEAVVAWARAECIRQKMDPKNAKYIRSVLEPVLKLIRFPQMSAADFSLKVARLKILTSDEVVDILQYFHVPPAHRATLPSEFFISTSREYHKPSPAVHLAKRLTMDTAFDPGSACDAVTQVRFKVDKCVWISSIGISPPAKEYNTLSKKYEPATNVKLKVKAEIRHSEDEDTCFGTVKKEVNPKDGTTDPTHVEFKEPIRINANVWYIICVSIKILQGSYHNYTYKFIKSQEYETGVTFEFTEYYSPDEECQIPEIGYRLDD